MTKVFAIIWVTLYNLIINIGGHVLNVQFNILYFIILSNFPRIKIKIN